MKKKKILIALSSLHIGGIQKVMINFLNQVDYNNYDVDLVLWRRGGEFDCKVPKEIKIYSIRDEHPWFKNKNIILHFISGILRKIMRFLNYKIYLKIAFNSYRFNSKNYDIAISFGTNCPHTDYYIVFAKARKKYIWVHSDYNKVMEYNPKFKKDFYKFKSKFKYFDKIICVSNSAAQSFKKLLPEYKNKLMIVWNLIDNKETFEKAIKEKTKIKLTGKYKIVSIGRLVDIKGFDRLIEIARMMKEEGYSVKFFLIGDGPKRNDLEKKVKNYGLTKNFYFLGKISNPFPILAQADLFVLTSYFEGLPTVILESLVCKVPFVAPNISGAKDIFKYIAPKGSGLLANNSIKEIYNKILEAMDGKITKNFIFDVEKYNKQIMREYYKIFNE